MSGKPKKRPPTLPRTRKRSPQPPGTQGGSEERSPQQGEQPQQRAPPKKRFFQKIGMAVLPVAKKPEPEPVEEEPLEEEPLEEPLEEEAVEEEPVEEEPLEEEPLEEEEPEPVQKESPQRKRPRMPTLPRKSRRGGVPNRQQKRSPQPGGKRGRIPPSNQKRSPQPGGNERKAPPKLPGKDVAPKKVKPKTIKKNSSLRRKKQESSSNVQPVQKPTDAIQPASTKKKESVSDEEYLSDDNILKGEDEYLTSEFYEVESGVDQDKNEVAKSKYKVDAIRYKITNLSPHKTGSQYICPRFNVEKYNPRTKMKLLQKQRVWEVNFCEQAFFNMRRKDYFIKKSIPFKKLLRVKIEDEGGQEIIVLVFKGMHQYRLKCASKPDLMKFYEVCKCALQNHVIWVPELINKKMARKNMSDITKVEFTGKFHYESSKQGEFVVEEKELIRTHLYVSTQCYEKSKVWIGTWNLCSKNLPKKDKVFSKFIPSNRDIYALCFQQANRKQDLYVNYFRNFFKKFNCHLVQVGMVSNVILMVFVRKEHINGRKISRVFNVIKKAWTKHDGVIIIRMNFNESPLCFIGCSLAEGETNYHVRMKQIVEVDSLLKDNLKFSIYHHIFWFGDLNFRISLPPKVVIDYLKKNRKELFLYEQLVQIKRNRGQMSIFQDFTEPIINFNPTYPCKDEKAFGGRDYITSITTPSYNDRILHKSYPGLLCKCEKYDAVKDIMGSFHTPVFAVFDITTMRCHVSHFTPPGKKRKIVFEEIFVSGRVPPLSGGDFEIGHPTIIKDPCLCFVAEFLNEKIYKTKKLKKPFNLSVNPKFEKSFIPTLIPSKNDLVFLESEYIIVYLKDVNEQIYGYAVLPLRDAVRNLTKEVKFEIPLFCSTLRIGKLSGSYAVV